VFCVFFLQAGQAPPAALLAEGLKDIFLTCMKSILEYYTTEIE
jgi:hypothetical protein